MKRLEERIMKLEDEEATLNAKLTEAAHAKMGIDIAKLSKSVKKIKAEIDSCFERLETITNEHDKLAAIFDARLAELG